MLGDSARHLSGTGRWQAASTYRRRSWPAQQAAFCAGHPFGFHSSLKGENAFSPQHTEARAQQVLELVAGGPSNFQSQLTGLLGLAAAAFSFFQKKNRRSCSVSLHLEPTNLLTIFEYLS